jgi:hypothetical protein
MSAAALDLGVPLFHRVEFHPDRRKAAAVGIAAVIAGGMIAYPAAIRQAPLQGFAEMLTAAIAVAGATMLIAAGAYMLLRLLLWQGAAIIIDSQGIHDRRAGDAVMPWSIIHDIRILDRHGHHIGIETIAATPEQPARRQGWMPARMRQSHANRVTVIDTFFLRSRTGNRVLDFVMPLTALAPVDMSETPVSEDTLSADARLARLRIAAVVLFVLAAGVIPAGAATILLLN